MMEFIDHCLKGEKVPDRLKEGVPLPGMQKHLEARLEVLNP